MLSHSSLQKERQAQASAIMREIQGNGTNNLHTFMNGVLEIS